MNNKSYIRKAVFVYDLNKSAAFMMGQVGQGVGGQGGVGSPCPTPALPALPLISHKYDGVTEAQRALNINHSIIKKYANIGGIYKGYIFSYERLNS